MSIELARIKTSWGRPILALALALCAAAPVWGQAGTGVIHGRVLGAGGGLLANASVTAKDMATGVAVTKLTGLDGTYSLEGLPPAMYEVTAALCAYSAAVTKDVELRPGAGMTVDFELACAVPPVSTEPKPTMDIYGFVMLDTGYQTRPEPSRLVRRRAAHEAPLLRERVRRGRALVRQRPPDPARRQGHQADLAGRAQDAVRVRALRHRRRRRQTTFRLRHAYGELGHFGRRPDLEPVHGHRRLPELGRVLGSDRHGLLPQHPDPLDADPGRHPPDASPSSARAPRATAATTPTASSSRTSRAASPTPTSPASTGMGGDWGYFEAAGILRYIKWDDVLDDQFDLSGSDVGWGINLSSNVKLGKNVLRLQGVYGEGIENYMNDAPADLGTAQQLRQSEPRRSRASCCRCSDWSPSSTSTGATRCPRTIGYSSVDIDNSSGQSDDAFTKGEYALANILFYPVPNADVRTGDPVGPSRELPRRLLLRRPALPVHGQVQLQPSPGRKVT